MAKKKTAPKSDLIQDLERVNKAIGDAVDSLVPGPALKVIDHTELASQILSPEAQAQMSARPKATNLKTTEEGVSYETLYLTVRTKHSANGIKAISHALNKLANHSLIHSVLAPPSEIELHVDGVSLTNKAVFAFVLVPSDKMILARSLVGDVAQEEGEVGKDID